MGICIRKKWATPGGRLFFDKISDRDFISYRPPSFMAIRPFDLFYKTNISLAKSINLNEKFWNFGILWKLEVFFLFNVFYLKTEAFFLFSIKCLLLQWLSKDSHQQLKKKHKFCKKQYWKSKKKFSFAIKNPKS